MRQRKLWRQQSLPPDRYVVELDLPLPARAPSASPSVTANETDEEKKQDGSDRGVGNSGNRPGTKMDIEPGQQPSTYEGAQDADDHVAHDPRPCAAHDVTGQPSGQKPDYKSCNETLAGHELRMPVADVSFPQLVCLPAVNRGEFICILQLELPTWSNRD